VFSPDGTRVAFTRESDAFTSSNIVLADSTGVNGNVVPLTANAEPVRDSDPTWQPLNPPTCDVGGKATSKSVKKVSVTVSCPTENATVVAEGSGKAPKPRPVLARKAKKFSIPPVTVAVPAGVPTTITLTVSKKGQKALKKATKAGKKGKATISLTLTDDLAQTATDTQDLKFKAKK
jgi:hypothetical protein